MWADVGGGVCLRFLATHPRRHLATLVAAPSLASDARSTSEPADGAHVLVVPGKIDSCVVSCEIADFDRSCAIFQTVIHDVSTLQTLAVISLRACVGAR
jgi:hypothetical protein